MKPGSLDPLFLGQSPAHEPSRDCLISSFWSNPFSGKKENFARSLQVERYKIKNVHLNVMYSRTCPATVILACIRKEAVRIYLNRVRKKRSTNFLSGEKNLVKRISI